MDGRELKRARMERRWSGEKSAARLGVSQPYLSLLENGRRPLTPRLQRKARAVFRLGPETLPLPEGGNWDELLDWDRVAQELGALGYPGYAALGRGPVRNPSELLVRTLAQPDVEPRMVEALPWLLLAYPTKWEWLLPRVKALDGQSRLGFLVSLARQCAEQLGQVDRARELADVEATLGHSKLAAPDSFRRTTMTMAEKQWLAQNRPAMAHSWNVLSDVSPEHLQYGS